MSEPKSLFEKIWNTHVIKQLSGGSELLHIDRVYLHDLSGARAFEEVVERGHSVRNPELVFAIPDHLLATTPGRNADSNPAGAKIINGLARAAEKYGVRHFATGDARNGIVHVVGPEQGLTVPGALVVCGDSHTSTHGGMGALAWGIGSSELVHALATQTVIQHRPKTMRVRFKGEPAPGVTAKDMILHLIGVVGAGGGTGYAVEYSGPAIANLEMEGRMTICNMSIEFGARMGMIAPDQKTIDYVEGRRYAPKGALWQQAVANWRELESDDGAHFDREIEIDAGAIREQITWGNSVEQTIAIDGRLPLLADIPDPNRRAAAERALEYMGLSAGAAIAGTPVDWVFIGSCTNGRLSDLRAAAAVAKNRQVAEHVTAWIVPGSEAVKKAAEAEGLHEIFSAAGFSWREPGCAMCVATNGETVPAGARSVSTTNRNFVGRQGPGSRTHLASPAVAAASAIAGAIADPATIESLR